MELIIIGLTPRQELNWLMLGNITAIDHMEKARTVVVEVVVG